MKVSLNQQRVAKEVILEFLRQVAEYATGNKVQSLGS